MKLAAPLTSGRGAAAACHPSKPSASLRVTGGARGGEGRARAGRARKSMLNSSSKSERVDAVAITTVAPKPLGACGALAIGGWAVFGCGIFLLADMLALCGRFWVLASGMTGGDDVSCCPVELMVFGREIQIAPHLPGCHATAAGYRNRAGTTSGY